MADNSTKEILDDGLNWATNEIADLAQDAFKHIIYLHLANNDEFLVDALAHIATEGWISVSPVLGDLWTDAIGEVMGTLNGSMRVAAMEATYYS